jgi:hypothetical protein
MDKLLPSIAYYLRFVLRVFIPRKLIGGPRSSSKMSKDYFYAIPNTHHCNVLPRVQHPFHCR